MIGEKEWNGGAKRMFSDLSIASKIFLHPAKAAGGTAGHSGSNKSALLTLPISSKNCFKCKSGYDWLHYG